jgi:hypothetical protein
MHRFDQKGLATGVIYVVFGAAVAMGSVQYPIGSFHRMGPGFFPLMVSLCLIVAGLVVIAIAVSATARPVALERWSLRNLGLVTAALAAFAVLIRPGGVIVATTIMVCIGSFASRDLRPRDVLISVAVLNLLTWLLFIRLLGLQLTMLPRALGN